MSNENAKDAQHRHLKAIVGRQDWGLAEPENGAGFPHAVPVEPSSHKPLGNKALFTAIQHNKIDAVRQAINDQANVNAQDYAGDTPAIYAAMFNRPQILALLIENGADVTLQNGANATALSFAVAPDHALIADILLASGADLEVEEKGKKLYEMEGATHLQSVKQNGLPTLQGLEAQGITIDVNTRRHALEKIAATKEIPKGIVSGWKTVNERLSETYTALDK